MDRLAEYALELENKFHARHPGTLGVYTRTAIGVLRRATVFQLGENQKSKQISDPILELALEYDRILQGNRFWAMRYINDPVVRLSEDELYRRLFDRVNFLVEHKSCTMDQACKQIEGISSSKYYRLKQKYSDNQL